MVIVNYVCAVYVHMFLYLYKCVLCMNMNMSMLCVMWHAFDVFAKHMTVSLHQNTNIVCCLPCYLFDWFDCLHIYLYCLHTIYGYNIIRRRWESFKLDRINSSMAHSRAIHDYTHNCLFVYFYYLCFAMKKKFLFCFFCFVLMLLHWFDLCLFLTCLMIKKHYIWFCRIKFDLNKNIIWYNRCISDCYVRIVCLLYYCFWSEIRNVCFWFDCVLFDLLCYVGLTVCIIVQLICTQFVSATAHVAHCKESHLSVL